MTNTKYTPYPLTIIETEYKDQYYIRSNSFDLPEGVSFDDAYVCISGYYGTYGPHVFAAAPELLEALEMAVLWLEFDGRYDTSGMKYAIAKAKGQTT